MLRCKYVSKLVGVYGCFQKTATPKLIISENNGSNPMNKWMIWGVFSHPYFLLQHPYTPPKTNMEPENGPLEKEIPIGNHHFQVPY